MSIVLTAVSTKSSVDNGIPSGLVGHDNLGIEVIPTIGRQGNATRSRADEAEEAVLKLIEYGTATGSTRFQQSVVYITNGIPCGQSGIVLNHGISGVCNEKIPARSVRVMASHNIMIDRGDRDEEIGIGTDPRGIPILG
jgi:hypothetical protein